MGETLAHVFSTPLALVDVDAWEALGGIAAHGSPLLFPGEAQVHA